MRGVKLGLIGYPLSHSISPAMQAAALEAAGLAGSYKALETPTPFLRARMQEVRREYRGVNLTIPYKESVIPYLDEFSSEAQAIGAVNTVVNESGKLIGFNTDASGFLCGLDEAGISYRGKKVIVLGAGGAARAIAYALKQEEAQVALYNRTPERAKELSKALGTSTLTLELLEHALKSCDLLINTTSVGLKDEAASPLPQGWLPTSGVVVDIVYNPTNTKLMRDTQAKGLRTLGGLPMLVWQGALAFELWTGHKADIARMYEAARRRLVEVQ